MIRNAINLRRKIDLTMCKQKRSSRENITQQTVNLRQDEKLTTHRSRYNRCPSINYRWLAIGTRSLLKFEALSQN